MLHRPRLTRRDFLRMAGGSALGLLSGCISAQSLASSDREPSPPSSGHDPDVELALRAVPAEVQIRPGSLSAVWTYRAELLGGDPGTVEQLPNSYLGPILRFRRGQRVRIHFANRLPEPSIVHWHGLHVPQEADGHPRLAIGPAETYVYDFQVDSRAGTYWYHPHPHTRTGPQVYYGLAGLLLVSDPEEAEAGLPAGEYDLPLVIQDRTFGANNQLLYLANGPMDRMTGYLGDQILVNGRPDYSLAVATRAYRLRILNGSNARTYKLGWHDGTPLTVIATDGGLLERPVEREYVVLGPAERIELWADFSDRPLGTELRLQSLPFFGDELGGMMGGSRMMGRGPALPNGSEFTVMRVQVERQAEGGQALSERLSTIHWPDARDAVNWGKPRQFDITMQRMGWFLNGRTFEMEDVAREEVVGLGDLEAWEFVNQRGGMSMIHPMHIHNLQFQVLERQVLPGLSDMWDTVREGYVDEGWKDTVLLMPGERVKLLMRFEDYAGLYLYHCHNLEHEDLGLMRNYRVRA